MHYLCNCRMQRPQGYKDDEQALKCLPRISLLRLLGEGYERFVQYTAGNNGGFQVPLEAALIIYMLKRL